MGGCQLAQRGFTLLSGLFRQLFNRVIKRLPVAITVFKQGCEAWHPLVLEAERQQLGVIHRGIDPRVKARVTPPLLIT